MIKRKGCSKGCEVTGRRATYDEQNEAPNGTGIDVGDFEEFGGAKKQGNQDLDLEVEFIEDI